MWRSSNEQQGLKPSAFSIRTGHLQSVVGQIRGIKRLLKGLMLFWRKSHKEECWKRHFLPVFTTQVNPRAQIHSRVPVRAHAHTLPYALSLSFSVSLFLPHTLVYETTKNKTNWSSSFALGPSRPHNVHSKFFVWFFSSSSFQTHYVDKKDRFGSSANLFKHFSFTGTLNHKQSQWLDHDWENHPISHEYSGRWRLLHLCLYER